jgi:hypothetical protein
MRRVCVIGNSGSGKTTLAAALATRLDAPHLELDSVYHQAEWQPLPDDEFRARVDEFTGGDCWVVDGNYRKVRDLVWGRADTIVVLDLPRSIGSRLPLAGLILASDHRSFGTPRRTRDTLRSVSPMMNHKMPAPRTMYVIVTALRLNEKTFAAAFVALSMVVTGLADADGLTSGVFGMPYT